MTTLQVGRHDVDISRSGVSYDSDDFDIYFDDQTHKTLHIDPEYDASFELMSCKENSTNSLRMDHLYVPYEYRDNEFGKLGVAFFYYLLNSRGYRKFSMKFGGGSSSAGFLRNLGFDHSDIQVKRDVEYNGESVMVGELLDTGNRSRMWSLRPISISKFPKGFFSIE